MEIPKEVKKILRKLEKNGFTAYIVGGCVRDLLQRIEPKDWDITTNAKPEEIIKIFPKNFAENNFGTVTVLTDGEPPLREIEITTYRIDEKYTDKRRPDAVRFTKNIREDLARRDLTVNAIAMGLKSQIQNHKFQINPKSKIQNPKFILIDPFDGQKDLKNKIIRTVGNPEDRFNEDALRMLRAVRLAIVLGPDWQIEEKTFQAIIKNGHWLKKISSERIRDELNKMMMSERASDGIELLRQTKLLQHIIPEIEEGYQIEQNKHHIYDVYEHNLLSLKYAAEQGFNQYVRWAALLHDVGKPRSKQGQGRDSTFYNHEIIGARMSFKILNRLKFPKKDVEKIVKLVQYHLFYYNIDEVSDSSVRRLVRKVGLENMNELLQVRMADRIGSGVPKAEPYKLRHLRYAIEKVSRDPISVKMLKVSGIDIMKILDIKPGPKIGQILDILLEQVLDEPEKNKKEDLEEKIKELGQLNDTELFKIAQKSREKQEQIEMKQDEMTKKKYWVS